MERDIRGVSIHPVDLRLSIRELTHGISYDVTGAWIFGSTATAAVAMAVVVANLAGEVMIKVSPIPGSLLDVKKEVTHGK